MPLWMMALVLQIIISNQYLVIPGTFPLPTAEPALAVILTFYSRQLFLIRCLTFFFLSWLIHQPLFHLYFRIC